MATKVTIGREKTLVRLISSGIEPVVCRLNFIKVRRALPGIIRFPTFFSLIIVAGGMPAFGQSANSANGDTAASSASTSQVEQVIVTGSRIRKSNVDQPMPMTVVSSEQIELTGQTSLADIVKSLPGAQNNMAANNNAVFGNGAGASFLDLRGLGEYRTLVLVDGIRHVGSLSGRNGDGGTSLVDINAIPPSLIDHVDVITGGTSAIYGADAVAGVANIILKKSYDGMSVTAKQSFSGEPGWSDTEISGIAGSRFANDRGSFMFAFEWNDDRGLLGKDRKQVSQGAYSLVPNPLAGTSPNQPLDITLFPTRSSTTAANGEAVIRTQLGNNPVLSLAVSPDGSQLVPFDRGFRVNPGTVSTVGDSVSVGGDGVIAGQTTTLRSPNARVVVDTVINYDLVHDLGIISTANVFLDAKYSDSSGTTENRPRASGTGSPADGVNNPASGGIAVSADNPFIPPDLKALMSANNLSSISLTRLNTDWFSSFLRQYDSQVFRAVAGVKGDLTNGWNYQAFYNYGQNVGTFLNGTVYVPNWLQELDAVSLPDGTIACRDPSNGCQPINPFKVGPLTAAQLAYTQFQTHQRTAITQNNAGANLTGDLFSFANPISHTVAPVSFAVGVEYRKEATDDKTDYLLNLANPNQTSFGIQPELGKASYTVWEGYAELAIPILKDLPFAKSLDADMAGRFSSYSTTGSSTSWNLQGNWAVDDSVRFRSSLARAVRAPNIDDLYSPQQQTFTSLNDPCSSEFINAGGPARIANCRAAGIPVGFRQSDFSPPYVLQGGNPNLKDEIGNTLTAGFVLTPTFIPNFSLSADYFLIKIRGGQEFVDASGVVNGCYDLGVSADCALITRRADHSIDHVPSLVQNVGLEKEDGVDIQARYRFDLEGLGLSNSGALSLIADGTYTPEHWVIQDPTDPTSKAFLAGSIGYPKIGAQLRAIWNWDSVTVAYSNRIVGPSHVFTGLAALASPPLADFNGVSAFYYQDLAVSYIWDDFILRAGVNNFTDQRAPQVPLVYAAGSPNYSFGGVYPVVPGSQGSEGIYDNLGRTFFVDVTANL